MNIQEAVIIAYKLNKWIMREGGTCKIKPTDNESECCLIAPSENYPDKKRPSKYWNPMYIDLVSNDWVVLD